MNESSFQGLGFNFPTEASLLIHPAGKNAEPEKITSLNRDGSSRDLQSLFQQAEKKQVSTDFYMIGRLTRVEYRQKSFSFDTI